MLKARVYKLKSTKIQEQQMAQIFGNCRFVYNRALNLKTTTYKETGENMSAFTIMKELTKLKKIEWMEWLSLSAVCSMQKAIVNMDTAFKNFYKWKWFPKFKNKKSKQVFVVDQDIKIDYDKLTISIAKVWKVKFFDDSIVQWEIKRATITKRPSWYYASVLYDDWLAKEPTGWIWEVWLDLWLKHFLVTSEWDKHEVNKPFCDSQKQLRVLQRKLARQSKWSKRRDVTKKQIARLYEKISNQREDYLHKLSTSIAKKYDTVYIENLNVAGMMKNRRLAKHIADVGRWMFATMLKYKCNNVVEIGRFEPSSKLCSNCGHIYGELKLSERGWTCQSCGATHDRDINAAVNIKNLWAGAQLADAKTKQ